MWVVKVKWSTHACLVSIVIVSSNLAEARAVGWKTTAPESVACGRLFLVYTNWNDSLHGSLDRYVKLQVCMHRECQERFPYRRLQRKPLLSAPGMDHSTCVTHVSWCMSGSLIDGGRENVPGIPGAWSNSKFTIWQEIRSSEPQWLHVGDRVVED